jgi:hypothetical protein
MKQDRFLLGILAGIAVLVFIALVVFFLRPDNLEYGEDLTPEGVVRNYIVAIHLKDYEKAYTYLTEGQYKPTLEEFTQPFLLNHISPGNAGVEVLESQTSGDGASVQLSILYNPGDPFSGSYRNSEYASLERQDNLWKIKEMPYTFWSYDWYQEPYEEIKP